MPSSAGATAGGRLLGVGIGPGDPELITLKALRALRESDRVVAPTLAIDAVGRAESVVREALPGLRVERLVFEMSSGSSRDQASARSHEAAARRIAPWLDAGEQVAFVTLGDPSVYSTFSSLAAEVRSSRAEVEVGTVPGVMAFQALASESGTVLLEGTQALSLVTALDGAGPLESALASPERAIAVYKGGRHFPEIAAALRAAGRLEDAVAGELLGLPGQRVAPLSQMCDRPATYLATVVVPPRAGNEGRREARPGPPPEGGAR